MNMQELPKIGMRKIKSVMALFLSFLIWQIVRVFFPQLDIHPLFGYIYAIIEMRDSVEKTKLFGKRRIKATFIGLAIGLLFLPFSNWYGVYAGETISHIAIDVCLIIFGVLVTLWIAELLKCDNFCGIAAIIFVICMVRDKNADMNIYLYAIIRVLQTLLGVFSAWVVNCFICRYPKEKS
ncbi:MAG: hypothetical protein IJD36_00255 [Clostridia bacterium]|nr:hypothetical protein [Clostridia bacterium]